MPPSDKHMSSTSEPDEQTSVNPPQRTERQFAILGGTSRRGPWRVPRRVVIISLVGGTDLDLTEAVFSASEVTIAWWSLLGGLTVIVPPGTDVNLSGFRLVGGRNVEVSNAEPRSGTTVNLIANSLVGGVKVRSPKAAAS
jgi:Cell wall-active antibiotics response LiaF, C-terminal